jgi:hypothetical protein
MVRKRRKAGKKTNHNRGFGGQHNRGFGGQ